MYGWTLLTILFSVVIVKADKVKFNLDKARLSQCLETYFLKDPSFKSKNFSHDFAEIIAEKFYDRSLSRVTFHKEALLAFYSIKNKNSHAHIDKEVMVQLRAILRKALEDCAEKANPPEFEYETPEMRNILDLILVDPPEFLFSMIRTKNGRAKLRAYVSAATASLMSALRSFSMNVDVFRHQLRKYWMLRAQRYFDGRNWQSQYIKHVFTTDRDRQHSFVRLNDVHTQDDLDLFVDRRNLDFSPRNPPALKNDKNKILKIHSLGLLQPRDDIYTAYKLFGMTSAQFYFENHVDQFYRIIFFILELGMRGIIDDESDIYDGPIPDSVMFNSTQEIIWTDEIYQSYLVYLSEVLDLRNGREEDFVTFFLECIEEYKNVTTEITTTTVSPWSTTSRDYQGWPGKKGGVREKDHGKHFLPKRPRACPDNQEQCSSMSGDNNLYYGYVAFYDDLDESVFLKGLRGARTFMNSLYRVSL